MNNELRRAKIQTARRAIFLLLTVCLVIVSVVACWAYTERLNAAVRQADMVPVRELIIDALRNTKNDAPIDPKTGDIYFPHSRLYLPNTSAYAQLTYVEDKSTGMGLSISSKALLNQGVATLYSAQHIRELFDKLPYLQACQRGVTVLFETTNDPALELRQTVQLATGKTAYLYIEKACPQLNETADLLKNLRSY